MRIARAMSIFVLFFMTTVYVLAFNDDQSQKTISGSVVDIDWAKSIITVRYSDFLSGNTDEINIIVPEETEITNGTETKIFSDIEQSDSVTVTYYDDGVSGLKAKKVIDLNEGNRDS
ncbi:MAG: hypothetical protein NTX89_02235 [Candidatus Omnitrophica bacterium]|nr:hypothetical protein [Candidatus Omnitrophota bacterium]